MLRDIDHKTVANTLTSKRGAGSTRNQAKPITTGETDHFPEILPALREHDTGG